MASQETVKPGPEEIRSAYTERLNTYVQKHSKLKSELAGASIKLLQVSTVPSLYKEEATLTMVDLVGPSPLGLRILKASELQSGRQYWPNACAHAVNDVLKSLGIDISSQVKYNPNWVPNYADLGQKVETIDALKPGDLVIYDNAVNEGPYDHIGIYAGNGMAYNVSTAEGYKFVLTPVGSTFQEGRRIGSRNYEAKVISVYEFEDETVNVKTRIFLLESEIRLNLVKSYTDYMESTLLYYSAIFCNLSSYQNYIENKIEAEEIEENKKNLEEELGYIKMLKAVSAETFMKHKEEMISFLSIIENQLALSGENCSSAEKMLLKNENSFLKNKLALIKKEIATLTPCYKELKKKFEGTENKTAEDASLPSFPPEYICAIDFAWESNENSLLLNETKRDLRSSLTLYTEGLVTYEKVEEFKEDYKKALLDSRLNGFYNGQETVEEEAYKP